MEKLDKIGKNTFGIFSVKEKIDQIIDKINKIIDYTGGEKKDDNKKTT